MPSTSRLLPLASFLVLGFAGSARAQTASTARPAENASQTEAVVLNAFTVNTDKDTGYQAADSLVGGRISANVLKTPADQTILTREFLDDIGALSYAEAGV